MTSKSKMFNYNGAQPNPMVFYDQNGQMMTNHVMMPPQQQLMPANIASNTTMMSYQQQANQAQPTDQTTSQMNPYPPIVPTVSGSQQQSHPNYQWQTVSKKRGRSPEENVRVQRQTSIKDYWLGSNRKNGNIFNNLENEDEVNPTESNSEKANEPKPPPIFIDKVEDINPLTALLTILCPNQYTMKALGEEQVKLQPNTGEAYTKITKALQEKKTEFHTYKPKKDKSFRVVLKNLHHSTNIEEIKNNVENLGHEVVQIWNVKQNKTKRPLSIFFVDLKVKENNKDIYNTKLFMNSSVIFEPPISKRTIPQCTRCQRYGHTKNFCQRNYRCVKCAEHHETANCPRNTKDNSVKCVNCMENHPANYRGCKVHKDLQQKLYPKLREKITVTTTNSVRLVNTDNTYAQVTAMPNISNNPNGATNIQQSQSNDLTELKNMMRDLITQMGTIMNLITTLVTKLS